MNSNTNTRSRNIIETILVVFLLLALLVAMYDVLHLFFGVLTFALVFAISFETVFEWLVKKLKSNRKLAAFIYSVLLIAVIALPLGFLFSSLARNVKPAIAWINEVKENGLPPLPPSVANIPLVGKEVAALWNTYHDDPKQIIADHQQQVQQLSHQAVTSGAGVLGTVLNVIIGIIISALLLVNKNSIIASIRLPLEHLLGKESGASLLDAIAMSIRGVSIGVMGTALIAATLAFIGLEIAGVHFAVGLSAIVFFSRRHTNRAASFVDSLSVVDDHTEPSGHGRFSHHLGCCHRDCRLRGKAHSHWQKRGQTAFSRAVSRCGWRAGSLGFHGYV